MAICRTITLYGPLSMREHAKLLLENQPQVKRIDATAGLGQLKMVLTMPIGEDELIALLASSGINGFGITHA